MTNKNDEKEIIVMEGDGVVVDGQIVKADETALTVPTQQYDFNRVNFENIESVRDYGGDIFDEIRKLIANASKYMKADDLPVSDFKARVDRLSGFENQLNELEKKRDEYAEKSTKPKSLVTKILLRTGLKKEEDKTEELSYKTELQKYNDNVDELKKYVEQMFDGSKNDFEVFDKFLKDIIPYIKVLQEVHELGVYDRDQRALAVSDLEAQYLANPTDEDLKRESNLARYVLDFYDDKLDAVGKYRINTNNTVMQWQARQINGLKLAVNYDNFLKIDIEMIRLNGTAIVGAKKQKRELDMMEYLNEGYNRAMSQSATDMNENIRRANELAKKGNLHIDTLVTVDEKIREGIQLFKDGAEEKKAYRAECARVIDELAENFTRYTEEVGELVLMEAAGSMFPGKKDGKVKSIGSKRTTKKQ